MCAVMNGKKILRAVSQQGCAISVGHITHSWDARAVWKGHSSLSHTNHTPAVSALIKFNPQHYIMLCRLFRKDNSYQKAAGCQGGKSPAADLLHKLGLQYQYSCFSLVQTGGFS